ncbi:LCA5L protein, partial [Jacana jacana]|nr:LCA5L protein [Jacana jacana]
KELPAEKTPHRNSSFLSLQSSMISQKKNAVAQRISSARLHKMKELKNEISYLHYRIEASSLENHILKQIQCRHSKAIGRYESSESNLQGLLASHYNEVRALRKLLRRSQEDERNTSRKLRKVEAELLKAKDALQTLLRLSEDKTLAEREDLGHKLSVLTEKMEVNDKKIQSLEKQLKLNNSTFRRQLASENKKAVEAEVITKNLQVEINCLHQKIKEKDRQLHVKNIYANRMSSTLKDSSGSVPHEKSLSISRSVQVDEQSFRSLLLSQFQTQETEKTAIRLTKEKNSSEDENQKAKANEAYVGAQGRTDKQSTKETPTPETLNRPRREYLREGRLLVEDLACLEYMKEEGKEKDLREQDLRKLMKTEETPLSDSIQENNHRQDAVEEYEKEEERPDEQLNDSEKLRSKCVAPAPRNKPPLRLQKKYLFSEATENLHYGLPTPGTKPKKGSLGHHRRAGEDCSETAELKVENSFGLYEPSFGQVAKTRQKDRSTEAGDCAHVTFTERKLTLMKELFGPGCV